MLASFWKGRGIPKYMKLLLIFSLLIGALPVLALGTYSYIVATNDAEQKTKESQSQLLAQTQNRIEQMMKSLELMSIQFSTSSTVTLSLREALDVTNLAQVQDLSKGLYGVQALSNISEGYLIDIEHDWVMSLTSVAPLSRHPIREQLSLYEKQPSNMFWDTGSLIATGNGVADETVRLVQKLPIMPLTQQPRGFLIFGLPKSQFQNILLQKTEELGHMYVLDRYGNEFLEPNKEETAKYNPTNARILEKIQQNGESIGFLYGSVGDNSTLFTYRHTDYNGWTYVYALSTEEMRRQTRKIAIGTLVAHVVILLIVGVLAWIISRRMYSPIKRLNELTMTVSANVAAIGSGKDEFSSLEERFRSLFSKGQQLNQQVQDQFAQLKEFLILKLFAGQLTESDFAHRSMLYGFPTEWESLAVLTLQIDTLQDTRYRSHDRDLLLFAVHNMASELIPAHTRFSPVLLNQYQVTIIKSDLTDEGELRQYYFDMAELLKSKVQQYLQVSVSIGISRPFTRTTDAVRAYNESLEALKSRIYLGHGIILHYDDMHAELSETATATYTQLKWTEEQLVQALKLSGPDKAESWLQAYMSVLTERNVAVNDYPLFMMQLVSRLYQLVHEKGGSVQQVLGENASYSELMKLNTMEDTSEWFKRELLDPIGEYLTQLDEIQYESIANKVVKLIEEKYNRDITLEGCAAELNFHPVYLGRVFKKETGMSFSDYLIEFRIKLAKEWLKNTTMKISDISEKLNYSNTTAFIRIFRKVVGMTPGQYREQTGNIVRKH